MSVKDMTQNDSVNDSQDNEKNASCIVFLPYGTFDIKAAEEIAGAGWTVGIDLTPYSKKEASEIIRSVSRLEGNFSIRTEKGLEVADFTKSPSLVISVNENHDELSSKFDNVFLEVGSLNEAEKASNVEADGYIAKGTEASPFPGMQPSWLIFRKLVSETSRPVIPWGGIGPVSTASYMLAGAAGLILDDQLLVFHDFVHEDIKKMLEKFEPTDTQTPIFKKRNLRIYGKTGTPIVRKINQAKGKYGIEQFNDEVMDVFKKGDLFNAPIPIGMDAAMSKFLKRDYGNLGDALKGILEYGMTLARRVMEGYPIGPGKGISDELGTELPIVQGPMANISEVPRFAKNISEQGALPVLGLGGLREGVGKILADTKKEVSGSFGAGIVAIEANAKARDIQFEEVLKHKPTHCILAGGRPAMVKKLVDEEIYTFVHTPRPYLSVEYQDQGIPVILEGNEAGGHIGKLPSFILWENSVLYEEKPLKEVLFAGGINDGLSALMTAPFLLMVEKGGIQMGTAYLLTKEAVESGAIKGAYQKEVLTCKETAVMGDRIGAPVRAVPNERMKKSIEKEYELYIKDIPLIEKKKAMENMNFGGLFTAAKGVEMNDEGENVSLEEEKHRKRGIFMMGDSGCLQKEVITIKDLHESILKGKEMTTFKESKWLVSVPEGGVKEDENTLSTAGREEEKVAIVGIGCVLPDANDCDQFWNNLLQGKYSIKEVPKDRWDPKVYYDPDAKAPDKTYTKIGSFIEDFEFNSLEFRIPPKMALVMDRTQKWGLTAVKQALQEIDLENIDRERVSVILGNSMGGEIRDEYIQRAYFNEIAHSLRQSSIVSDEEKEKMISELKEDLLGKKPEITEDSMPGELANIISGRIANVFDFKGENYTSDAACASSMAALMNAVSSLKEGRSDMVITGGIDTSMQPTTYIKFCKIGALSADGSFPYDERANGFVMGEGAVIFAMKRLSDALDAGDEIFAVIKGIGYSSDGRGKGITAPNPEGQKLAMERGLKISGLSPEDICAIEGHGTSTSVGDVVELKVIKEIYRSNPILLGSAKSNIGHLKSAAGAVGMLKSALSLKNNIFPPSINFRKYKDEVDMSGTNITIPDKPMELPDKGGKTRIGVSAFGFGGTNFHVILERYGEAGAEIRGIELHKKGRGKDDVRLTRKIVVGKGSKEEIMDFAHEIIEGKEEITGNGAFFQGRGNSRFYVVMDQDEEPAKAMERLKKAINLGKPLPGACFVQSPPSENKVAFIFPGQGSQYVGMTEDLKEHFQIISEVMEEADSVMKDLIPKTLTSYIYANKDSKEAFVALSETEITQPAILAVDTALLELLKQFNLKPDVTAGHSLGEYGALIASEAIPFDDALEIVSARGREMASIDIPDMGGMAVVSCNEEQAQEVLDTIDGYVIASNKNSPTQTVISGDTPSLQKAVEAFNQKGIPAKRIPVSAAFHSEMVSPAKGPLGNVLAKTDLRAPKTPLISNVKAEPYPEDGEEIKNLLVEQVASPVEWERSVKKMYEMGARFFIEVGPKWALTSFVKEILGDEVVAVPVNHPKKGGIWHLLDVLGAAYSHFIPVDLSDLNLEKKSQKTPPSQNGKKIEREESVISSEETLKETDRPHDENENLEKIIAKHVRNAVNEAKDHLSAKGVAVEKDVYVSGTSLGLPGSNKDMFQPDNFEKLVRGETQLEKVKNSVKQKLLEKNINRLIKDHDGSARFEKVDDIEDVISIAGVPGKVNLQEFGIPEELEKSYDGSTRLAIAAGIKALADAGIPLVKNEDPALLFTGIKGGWCLPEEYQEMGIIFASAWPGLEQFAKVLENKGFLPRDYLFRVLPMGHSQLAQLLRAKGPNTQMNSACASTSIAMAIAGDWIKTGKAKRVLVVAGDVASSDDLFPWLGAGFLAIGAGTTEDEIEKAAIPFSPKRNGLIVGSGAVGILLESEEALEERNANAKAKVIGTHFGNSAYHGSRLDVNDITDRLHRFMIEVSGKLNMPIKDISKKLLFVSHETYTPARGGSASAEAKALKKAFGKHVKNVIITNTKGFTGHSMAVGIEESVAVLSLLNGVAPPIANLKEVDEEFQGLTFSQGEKGDYEYALRLSAGFGSQIAFLFLERGKEQKQLEELRKGWEEFSGRHWRFEMDGPVLKAHPTEKVKKVTKKKKAEAGTVGGVIEVISEATGYPKDVLELDMDLEGDLGIDTVKQVEIFSRVRKNFDLPADDSISIADYNTIRKIGDYVDSLKTGDEIDVENAVLETISQTTGYPMDVLEKDMDLEGDLGIDTVKQVEIFSQLRERFSISKEVEISIADYPDIGSIIEFIHSHSGEKAQEKKPSINTWQVKRFEMNVDEPTLPDAISIRGDLPDELLSFMNDLPVELEDDADNVLYFAEATRNGLKRLFNDAKSLQGKGKSLIVVVKGSESDPWTNALMGFSKSLAKESGFENVRAISMDQGVEADALVSCIDFDVKLPEVYLADGKRYVKGTAPPEMAMQRKLEGKTFLITGATGDIMEHLLPKMSHRFKGRYLLLGRKSRDVISDTIAKMESNGSQVHYLQADLLEREKIREVLLEQETIDVIVHGAGIEISQSLPDKDEKTFDLVFDVKAEGLRNILDAVEKPVENVVVFSSVAGRYGNAGQGDYAAGNEEAVAIARRYAEKTGGEHIGIHWSAWDEVGMATKGGIKQILEMAGIDFIPLDVGIERYLELMGSMPSGEYIVAGSLGPMSKGFVHEEKFENETDHPWLENTKVEERVWKTRVKVPADSKIIKDHSIDGTGVLPGVLGLKLMTETHPAIERDDLVLANIRFKGPFIAGGEFLTGNVSILGNAVSFKEENGMGDFSLDVEKGVPDTIIVPQEEKVLRQVNEEEIYRHYFHGPTFRVVKSGKVSENVVNAKCNINNPLEMKPNGLVNPLLVEAGMQTAGLFHLGESGGTYLPVSMDKCFSTNVEGEVEIFAVRKGGRFDVQATANGKTALIIKGLVFVKKKGYAEAHSVVKEMDSSEEDLAIEEKERLSQIKNAKRRADYIRGRKAGRRALDRLGLKKPVILNGPTGRPFVKGHPEFSVSITHKDDIAEALAWKGTARMGIDIEHAQVPPCIAAEALSVSEANAFTGDVLGIAFSLKESYLKAAGVGFHASLKSVEIMEMDLERGSAIITGPVGTGSGKFYTKGDYVHSKVEMFDN